jgi:hypothetical protein
VCNESVHLTNCLQKVTTDAIRKRLQGHLKVTESEHRQSTVAANATDVDRMSTPSHSTSSPGTTGLFSGKASSMQTQSTDSIFITYTISEDLSGDRESVMRTRLARLGTKST